MRYYIDLFSSFLGTVTIMGWAEGGVPTAWSSSRVQYGPIEPFIANSIERPDLVQHFGPDSINWGFKLVFYIGEHHDPKDLYLILNDHGRSRLTTLYDSRTDEDIRFWTMQDRFGSELRTKRSGRLLDLGLPPSGPGILGTTDMPDLVYVGASDAPGPNVDVVIDFNDLSATLTEPFDFVHCVSVFDKVPMPWKLATELGKVLAPGGMAYVQSAGAWPYTPDERDFWRMSKHAWGALFTAEAGFRLLQVEQGGRARILLEQASTLHRGLEHHHHYTLSGCLVARM